MRPGPKPKSKSTPFTGFDPTIHLFKAAFSFTPLSGALFVMRQLLRAQPQATSGFGVSTKGLNRNLRYKHFFEMYRTARMAAPSLK
jgi:hypothetical protein